MSKARELADVIGTQDTTENVLQGRKNLIINGAMQVAQRGTTSGSTSTYGYHSLDRWKVNPSGGTVTFSQEEFTVGQTDVPGFPTHFMRLAVSTGDNNCGVFQPIEDVRTLGGKEITISFWAKGTNPTDNFECVIARNYGSGGSSSEEHRASSDFSLTSTWQKFTFTTTVPSISGKTIGTGSYVWVDVLRQKGTDTGTTAWTADIAQVQLEVGSVATPFEHRSYGEELALCQRYYYKVTNANQWLYAIRSADAAPQYYRATLVHPCFMRATPTMTYIDGSISATNTGNGFQYQSGYTSTFYVNDTNSSNYSFISSYSADAEL